MAALKTRSTMPGGVTPHCNDCGVALYWDVDDEEYIHAKQFWDDWTCKECNGGISLSLTEWKLQQLPLPVQKLNESLQQACERIGAGFYFEEGGCYGMALALQDQITKEGLKADLAVIENKGHAVVLLENQSFDYTGFSPLTGTETKLSTEDFLQYARNHGHTEEALFSAKEWALQAISSALEEAHAHS